MRRASFFASADHSAGEVLEPLQTETPLNTQHRNQNRTEPVPTVPIVPRVSRASFCTGSRLNDWNLLSPGTFGTIGTLGASGPVPERATRSRPRAARRDGVWKVQHHGASRRARRRRAKWRTFGRADRNPLPSFFPSAIDDTDSRSSSSGDKEPESTRAAAACAADIASKNVLTIRDSAELRARSRGVPTVRRHTGRPSVRVAWPFSSRMKQGADGRVTRCVGHRLADLRRGGRSLQVEDVENLRSRRESVSLLFIGRRWQARVRQQLVEMRSRQGFATKDDRIDPARVCDVGQGIAAEHDHTSNLALLDGAEVEARP